MIKKISVVMAAYNEAGNVEELAKRFDKIFKHLRIDFELVYVLQGNDGAKNGLERLIKNGMKNIRIAHFENPIGVGHAFRHGFGMAAKNASHVLTLDADLNHQPEELPKFVEAMKKHDCDIVIGSRLIKGGSMVKRNAAKEFVSAFVNFIGPAAFRISAKDITSGYRLYKKEKLDQIWPLTKARNFEFYPEMLIFASRKGFRMLEVPINFKPRTRGKSKMGFVSSGIGYTKLFIRTML